MSDALTSTDDLLRLACERGITHLTLYPIPSTDGKKIYWQARGTPSTEHKYIQTSDTDPVVALRGVLIGLPKAGKRNRSQSKDPRPGAANADPEITAAVTPVEPETLDSWLPKV